MSNQVDVFHRDAHITNIHESRFVLSSEHDQIPHHRGHLLDFS